MTTPGDRTSARRWLVLADRGLAVAEVALTGVIAVLHGEAPAAWIATRACVRAIRAAIRMK